MAVYLLVRGRFSELGLIGTAFAGVDPIATIQSVIQFFGFGFLLVRIAAAAGRLWGILICGVLYGVVKYPLYMTQYGMSFAEATGMIAFSAAVACVVFYLTLDRQDLLVLAILHMFMDAIQNL